MEGLWRLRGSNPLGFKLLIFKRLRKRGLDKNRSNNRSGKIRWNPLTFKKCSFRLESWWFRKPPLRVFFAAK
jgi:hypothetical protein